jgi:hypothetical protein
MRRKGVARDCWVRGFHPRSEGRGSPRRFPIIFDLMAARSGVELTAGTKTAGKKASAPLLMPEDHVDS